jgi:hypothetical protein
VVQVPEPLSQFEEMWKVIKLHNISEISWVLFDNCITIHLFLLPNLASFTSLRLSQSFLPGNLSWFYSNIFLVPCLVFFSNSQSACCIHCYYISPNYHQLYYKDFWLASFYSFFSFSKSSSLRRKGIIYCKAYHAITST